MFLQQRAGLTMCTQQPHVHSTCERGLSQNNLRKDSNKSNKEMRFPAFSLELLTAKIINIWQVGISVASFILRDLAVLCRLGKTEMVFMLMKCSFLQVRVQQVFASRKVHTCFEGSVTFEGWQSTCRAVQCPHCHPQEPLSAVSASRSVFVCAFCSQSQPYEVKQKSAF